MDQDMLVCMPIYFPSLLTYQYPCSGGQLVGFCYYSIRFVFHVYVSGYGKLQLLVLVFPHQVWAYFRYQCCTTYLCRTVQKPHSMFVYFLAMISSEMYVEKKSVTVERRNCRLLFAARLCSASVMKFVWIKSI